MNSYIKINQKDNVCVALKPIKKGEVVEDVIAIEDIPQGHKIALMDLPVNSLIIKYGESIGHSTVFIKKGSWVHTHNVKTNLSKELEYNYDPSVHLSNKQTERTFKGYVRSNGKVGIRNECWIIPTVGCVNSVAKLIEKNSQHFKGGNCEEIIAFNHPYGCSQMGDDQENTRQILANLAEHPNAGGVLVLGLGCENSGVEEIKKHMSPNFDTSRIRFLVSQKCEDEVEEAMVIIEELCNQMKNDNREEVSVSKLIVGLKCGGSDGLSGISANPCVGGFSDLIIAQSGTTILTEVPEMFGAETLLMKRCVNEEVFEKTVHLINDFKHYFSSHNQTIYENPSPGNKDGGITTLEDKSLGCTQKSGSAQVVDVLKYGEKVKVSGLNLLSAPGNDLVASTALAASGAQLVLFTTGRGTPFASPVPTVKISSNTQLYDKKKQWIDFNAGCVVDGMTMNDASKQLFNLVLEIASGKKVNSEKLGYHDMAIFKQGVTL